MLARFNAAGSLFLDAGDGSPVIQVTPRHRNYRRVAVAVTRIARAAGLLPAPALLESRHDLFTGTITDRLGRQRRYVSGKPVPIPHQQPMQVTFRPRAAAPAPAPLAVAAPEIGTRSDAFRAWFGDSAVVDGNGEPLRVYHGTAHGFDSFDPALQGKTTYSDKVKGFYFTASPVGAAKYSGFATRDTKSGDGQRIYPAYLAIRNPKIVHLEPGQQADSDEFVADAIKEGHDGLIVHGSSEAGNGFDTPTVYVAFSPNQIKSVNNRGTWDPADDRIAMSGGGDGTAPDPSQAAVADTAPPAAPVPVPEPGPDAIAAQRDVVAGVLRLHPHLTDVDALVKDLGLSLNRNELRYTIRKHLVSSEVVNESTGAVRMFSEDDKRTQADQIVDEVETAVLAHLAAQGMPAPDPSLTTSPPRPPEETDAEREARIAARKAKQLQEREDAKAFAEANYRKPPAPETVSRAFWTALRFKAEMVQIDKDYLKIVALRDLRDAGDRYPSHQETARRLTVRLGVAITYNDDGRYQYPDSQDADGKPIPGPLVPHELTNAVRSDTTSDDAAFQLEYTRPYVKRLLNRYKYSDAKRGDNQNLEGAVYQVGRQKSNMRASWDDGWFDYNAEGVHAVSERTEAIKKAFADPAFEPSKELLKEVAYETWVPQRFRDREKTEHYLKTHAAYLRNEHPYAKAHLDRAMARAAPKLAPIMELAATGAKVAALDNAARLNEAAQAETDYHAAVRAREDFESLYKTIDTAYEIPGDKLAEMEALERTALAAKAAFFDKSTEAVKLNHETGAAFLALLLPKDGNHIDIPANPALFVKSVANVAAANVFLSKAVAASWGDIHVKLEILPEGEHRANCGADTINTPTAVSTSTLVHEFGHRIEHQDGSTLGTLSRAFAMQQVLEHDGEIMHHLGAGYEPNEIGARDGFMDEYTGKFYPYQSSEVLSMGLQRLYDDPIEFYAKAPKHFAYTMACIHGFLTRSDA